MIKVFILLLCFPIFSVSAEELSCAQHFQRMYTTYADKIALEKDLKLCGETYQTYLSDYMALGECKNTIQNYCLTLTKSKPFVENYSYNPIKSMATLQLGYALGNITTSAILDWISPPMEIPEPTAKVKSEKAKKLTKTECLTQDKPDGTKGFHYDDARKLCLVSGCYSDYHLSSDHSYCEYVEEKKCIDRNSDSSWASANRSQHIRSYSFKKGNSPECLVASCESGWEINDFATGCIEVPEPEPEVEEVVQTDNNRGAGGGGYTPTGKFGDNAYKADAYAFRGQSSKIYFTGQSNANSTIPDGSPLKYNYVVSGYGMRLHPIQKIWKAHLGVDLDCQGGEPIYAPADGTVSSAGWAGGCGNAVKIMHSNGYATRYCHLQKIKTTRGAKVSRGDVIGLCGTTGWYMENGVKKPASTGNHLHYEVKRNGGLVNPMQTLTGGNLPG
ncbi:MAG: M23 family metallopeptidase [Alphaproteobacteria bacterium]